MLAKAVQMVIVWAIVAACIYVLINARHLSAERQRFMSKCVLFLFPLLMAFRTLGLDLANYERWYSDVFWAFWQQYPDILTGIAHLEGARYEPAHYLIALLFGQDGFRAYLYVSIFLPLLAVYVVVRRFENPLVFMAAFIAMNLFSMDVTRQFMASTFLILSLPIQSIWIAFAVALCGGLVHYGSLPGVSEILFRDRKISQVGFIFAFLGLIILFFLIKEGGLFSGLYSGSEYYSTRMRVYTDSSASVNDLQHLLIMVSKAVLFTLLLFARPSLLKVEKESVALNAAVSYAKLSLLVFFAAFVGFGAVLASRLFSLMSIGNFLLLGHYFEKRSERNDFLEPVFYVVLLNLVSSVYYLNVYL